MGMLMRELCVCAKLREPGLDFFFYCYQNARPPHTKEFYLQAWQRKPRIRENSACGSDYEYSRDRQMIDENQYILCYCACVGARQYIKKKCIASVHVSFVASADELCYH